MIRFKNYVAIFLVFVFLFVCSACSTTKVETRKEATANKVSTKKQLTLTISAASSLKDAMNELKNIYKNDVPDVDITYNFGASGSLEQQIENGANVDLFFSAAQKQMDDLKKKDLLEDDTRKNLLENTLVLVVPNDSDLSVTFEELTQDKVKKLAMGEPKSVPAGQYAQEVFKKLNIEQQVNSKVVYGKDAKEVLTWVETGNVDAGIVYETDAKMSQKVKVVAHAPEGSHKPIIYPVSLIKSSKNKEAAKAFINFISGEKGKIIFEKYEFKFLKS